MIARTLNRFRCRRRYFSLKPSVFFQGKAVFFLQTPANMHEGPKNNQSAPKRPKFRTFSRGKKMLKKKKKKLFFFKLVVLGVTGTRCQIVPGLREGLLIIFYDPFQRSCPLPRRNTRMLHTEIALRGSLEWPSSCLAESWALSPRWLRRVVRVPASKIA